MRIVIAGDGEISFRLAEQLMADHTVGLICSAETNNRVERLEVEATFGAITSTTVLRGAHVSEADLFIACSAHDEQNLVSCVIAKRLGADKTVCFLFRSEFHYAAGTSESLAESLGINLVMRPAEQLAKEILRIVAVPGALDVETFVGGKVKLFRHVVEEGSPVANGPLRDVDLPAGVVLVMARRGDDIFIPKGNTQLQPGDKITAMGNPAGMNRLLFKYLKTGAQTRYVRRVCVVGCGEVGLAVALGLEDAAWQVKVIESSRPRCEEISRVLNSLVLHGDGSDLHLLQEEHIADDTVLIAVTMSDEKNLLVSLLAKQLGVGRIITRASLQSNERLFERVGIDVVRSAGGAAIRSVVKGIVESRTELLAELEHGDAMVLEVTIPEGFPPAPLMKLKAPEFVIVGAILRGDEVIIPTGSDAVQSQDRLLIFCTGDYEEEARDFFLRRAVGEGR